MDFREILYLNIFRKSVEKIKVPLNPNKVTSTLHEYQCAFMIESR